MTRERLVPVKSESELRIGMVVVLKRCRRCSGVHRTMLIDRVELSRNVDTGDVGPAWRTAPESPCKRIELEGWVRAIAEGRLFRVDDGLDLEADKRIEFMEERIARHNARMAIRQDSR